MTKIISNINKDPSAVCGRKNDLNKLSVLLEQQGLMSVSNLSDIVRKTSKNTFKATISKFAYEHSETKENAELSIVFVKDLLKDIVISHSELRKQLLIIDGLDDILLNKEIQYISIAALINVIQTLNKLFRGHLLPIKIIILCRTDIFERLPDPNKNKIRRDFSSSILWYNEGVDTHNNSALIRLANKRTKLVYPEVEDLFTEFFPKRYDKKDIKIALLEYTRHTPRDFMQLLNCIQSHCTGSKVTVSDIQNGIKEYSSSYFLPEIKDEMTGYIPYDKIDLILGILGSYRSQELSYDDIVQSIKSEPRLSGINPDEALRVLYDCSAIGLIYNYVNGNIRYEFKYRSRNSTFNKRDKIQLHKGLWKALNVNF